MPTSPARAAGLVLFLALAAYLNSLGNGFAFDDEWFVVQNEVVTEQRYDEAFTSPSWPGAFEGTGNYRPLVLVSFAAEWSLWGGSPLGFHVVNVAVHALVSLLVLALLWRFVSPLGSLVGAALFAVHPVHVEAVANVMGRSELYAALAYLAGCLLYLRWSPTEARARIGRLLSLGALLFLGVGSKEIAVTFPAMLVVLEFFRRSASGRLTRLKEGAGLYLGLLGLTAIYVAVRWSVLGLATGANTTPGMQNVETTTRVLTAISVWPEYVRLMVFPLDLASDYGPAVFLFSESVTPEVVVGAMILFGGLGLAWALRDLAPAASLGLAWFMVAILPVSNLLVRSDIVLAERTLYLPSVGFALLVGAAIDGAMRSDRRGLRPALAVVLIVGGLGFFVRTVDRNPSWVDTFSVMRTLAEEHPESWRSQWAIAAGQVRVGDLEGASETYDIALQLAPDHYQLLVEVGMHEAERGRAQRADSLFQRAIDVIPDFPFAHARLAEGRVERGDFRSGHEAVTTGLRLAGGDRELFSLLSELYLADANLEGAATARLAAIGQDSQSAADWSRLADIRAAQGDAEASGEARRRAAALRGAIS